MKERKTKTSRKGGGLPKRIKNLNSWLINMVPEIGNE